MKTKTKTLLTIASLLLAICSQGQTPDYSGMDTLLSRIGRANKAMGTIVLFKNGKTLYQRSFGNAGAENKSVAANSSETAYRIGSVTKVYTATMIWQLIEAGKLSEGTMLSTFFPQIPDAKSITIAQMLSHHSGIYNFTEDTSFSTWSRKNRSRAELLSRFARYKPAFEPGAKSAYSNTNYVLLAFILEDLTKKSYADNLQERITGALGLMQTHAGTDASLRPNDARSFAFGDSEWQATGMENLSSSIGAGNITATAPDVARFMDALLKGRLVSPASVARMETQTDHYGMGLFQFPFYSRRSFGHTGHIDNFATAADYNPQDSLVCVMACNGLNTDFNKIAIGIKSLYYGEPFTMPDYNAAASVPLTTLQQYEGVYQSPDLGLDITVTRSGNVLSAQATGQSAFALAPVSNTEFSFEPAGIVLLFRNVKSGKAESLMLQQGGSAVPFNRKK